MRPSAVYTLPKGINSDGQKRMIAEIESRHTGLANAGKPLFMDFGSDVKPGMMTPEDAQTIEQRRFQISDICRAFGVPPHMIGETDKTTSWGTGIEQQTLGFLKFNLDRDLCRIEGELNRKLFTGTPFYAEYDREALNALDAMTTAQLYSIGVQNARYTPNEVRRKSNLPDMPGGNQLFIQGATIPITSAGKTPAPANDPEPVKPEPDPEETK
jgi:HK97 family phage portal protein